MRKLMDIFIELMLELDLINSTEAPWSYESGLSNFTTVNDKYQCYFSKKSIDLIREMSETLYKNESQNSVRIKLDEFTTLVRKAIAYIYVEKWLGELIVGKALFKTFRANISSELNQINSEITHYLMANTIGLESEGPFVIGPVTFLSKTDWITSVDFPDSLKDSYLNEKEANHNWKQLVIEAIENPMGQELKGLASIAFQYLLQAKTVAKVSISGYETEYSKLVAATVCKAALDGISLIFNENAFHQQVLFTERMSPISLKSMNEIDGQLSFSGSKISKRNFPVRFEKVKEAIKIGEPTLSALGNILTAFVSPAACSHPLLANRWITALSWFAEGVRESNDAIAVTKLATSLDVLSSGGKAKGILELIINLTGKCPDFVVIKQDSINLKRFVEKIYDEGRSRILHGNRYDLLESYNVEREYAHYLARLALIICAERLSEYKGEDNDKAFYSI